MNSNTIPKKIHVDRKHEMSVFQDMLTGIDTKHIFLIEAEGGMGKTSLLQQFWDAGLNHRRCRINLKQVNSSFTDILGELGHQLGPNHFARYNQRIQELLKVSEMRLEHSTLIGNKIDASFTGLDAEQRQMRRQVLTDVFLECLEESTVSRADRVVILLDTFDASSEDIKEWLAGAFLSRVRPIRSIVLVIAGREIPKLDIDWDEWCLRHTLSRLGIDDAREYLQRLELQISEETIEVIYSFTKGLPLDLVTKVGEWRAEAAREGNQK
jgi:hypothetical protein